MQLQMYYGITTSKKKGGDIESMNRKHYIIDSMIIVVLLTVVLTPLSGQQDGSYDPWMDLNDDGIIDVYDLQALASVYGTSGEPINKTALLLELQDRIDSLNASLLGLEARVNALEAPGSVTTERIADGAVTNTKLAPFAIPIMWVDSDSSASTTSTTFVDMPGMVATITIDRASILFILFSANAWNTDTWGTVDARTLVDGTSAHPAWIWLTENRETREGMETNAFNFYALVPSGDHTVKIQWKVTSGTAEALMRSLIIIALPT